MRVVRDLLKADRKFTIEGTGVTVQFKDFYAEIEDKYVHHFQFYSNFDVLPVGSKTPTPLVKKVETIKPVDVKTEKSDNINTESPKK